MKDVMKLRALFWFVMVIHFVDLFGGDEGAVVRRIVVKNSTNTTLMLQDPANNLRPMCLSSSSFEVEVPAGGVFRLWSGKRKQRKIYSGNWTAWRVPSHGSYFAFVRVGDGSLSLEPIVRDCDSVGCTVSKLIGALSDGTGGS